MMVVVYFLCFLFCLWLVRDIGIESYEWETNCRRQLLLGKFWTRIQKLFVTHLDLIAHNNRDQIHFPNTTSPCMYTEK